MKEVGIESCGGENDEGYGHMSLDDFERYKLDPKVSAVVVGLDTNYTYAKLSIASLYIHTGGCKFIATNDDAYDMVAGRKFPGAGAMVQSIKYSLGQLEKKSDEKKARSEPEIIGKPNPYVIDLIMQEHGITDKSRMVMIGDRPDTDMLLAHNAGVSGCLVFTGVTTSLGDLARYTEKDPRIKPTWIMNSFGVLSEAASQRL